MRFVCASQVKKDALPPASDCRVRTASMNTMHPPVLQYFAQAKRQLAALETCAARLVVIACNPPRSFVMVRPCMTMRYADPALTAFRSASHPSGTWWVGVEPCLSVLERL